MVDAIQINWTYLEPFIFSRFALIGRALAKPMRDKCKLIIVTSDSKSFDRLKPEPALIASESNIGLSGMKGLWQKYFAKDLSWLTVDLLEIS